jgi:catechol 2,3-dioxygenase-like lactoylglutathione lyase family enzyme
MRFTHTNIAAREWKSLAQFYINVFDCRIKPPERKLSGVWLDQATGLKDAILEGAHLLLPGYGENGPTLEVFTYADTIENKQIMANYKGFTHIAFEVEDVTLTYNLALQNGAIPLGDITEREISGVGFLTFVYLRDPEGNIVEIQSWEK